MKKHERQTQSGITLIALIITIVVVLILAAVTISLTLGERGIFNTAQQAGKNYKEASDKELADLSDLEREMQNVINGMGNGGTAKPEPQPQPVKLNTVTSSNYGDYIDYPINIGHGPDESAHKTDWRIFYNDGTYVYLISSYLLLNSHAPTGIGMIGHEGRPYTTYWDTEAVIYTPITDNVRTNYKMNWNKSTTNPNIKAVSTLLDTTKWTKFADSQYALDAIGAPTLEMWVESWNATGGIKLYYNNTGESGYYIGSEENTIETFINISNSKNLYFPVTSWSELTGGYYWLASPSACDANHMMRVNYDGYVGLTHHLGNYALSVRPIVRIKSDVMAKQENGIWKLQ